MINVSDAYIEFSARLNKKPVFLCIVEGYSRVFASRNIGGTYHQDLLLEVSNTTGPWDVRPGFNDQYAYDSQDWSPPVLYPQVFSAGDQISLAVDSSSGSIFSPGYFGAVPNTGTLYPLRFVAGYEDTAEGAAGHLMGAWCDLNGIVIQPVYIGFGPTTLTCPAGASRLQLGINDKQYNDNTGSMMIKLGEVDSDIVPWLTDGSGNAAGMLQDMTIAISDLDGGADLQGFIFNVQDFERLITADFPIFTFEGKRMFLRQGYLGMEVDDYATLFTGIVDTVTSDNDNLEYQFSCVDALQNQLARTIFVLGDDKQLTDSDHPRTLNGHPLNLVLDALLLGAGIPPSQIDFDKITGVRDGVYAGMRFDLKITSPPAARDFIQGELMRPLGAYLWVKANGQISVNFMYPLSLEPALTLDSTTLTAIPLEEQADLINQVEFQCEYDDDDKAQAFIVSQHDESMKKFGPGPLHTIEARGVRLGFQGVYLSEFVSRLIFLRYGSKNAKFEDSQSLINIWSPARIEPGDLIALTCPFAPDRQTGTMGFEERLFEVLDRTWHFSNMTVGFTLLRVNFDSFKQSLITSDGEANFPAASLADQNKYEFQCNDSDLYSDGQPGKTLC